MTDRAGGGESDVLPTRNGGSFPRRLSRLDRLRRAVSNPPDLLSRPIFRKRLWGYADKMLRAGVDYEDASL